MEQASEQGGDDRKADARLMERAIADPQAFGPLYERFYDVILNYAFRRTLSIAAAEEITSNTFFKALRAMSKYRDAEHGRQAEQGSQGRQGGRGAHAWLYAIATNELRMHWRWRRRHRAGSLEDLSAAEQQRILFDATPAAAGEAGGVEQHEQWQRRMGEFAQLHAALARLPERYQTVLTLRYFERLSLEQIAEVTGRPLGSVKSRLHRATAKLRKALDGSEESAGDFPHVHEAHSIARAS